MAAGYVYILINQSMTGLLKIGKTTRDSRQRARELSTTGVPTPFQVAFEIFSENHETLENDAHEQLRDFRVTNNREFFNYPLDKAIKLLQDLNSPVTDDDSVFAAVDILDQLKNKYPDYLKSDIAAVRIVQPQERVWLEITTEEEIDGRLKDQTIKRTDLGFIVAGSDVDELAFNPNDAVMVNAQNFVDNSHPYDLIMTTDLFHETACHKIDREWNAQRKDA